MRWPWLIFAVLLSCGILAFSVKAEWSSQTWLDLAAYAVSLLGNLSVFLYALDRAVLTAGFWRAFRWIFIGIVTSQALSHALKVAKQHNYSAADTVGFILMAILLFGGIYALQWIAMSRLAKRQNS